MRLRERVAVVTGAAQGIGAAIAREFAAEGAIVAALDRKAEVEQVAAAIVAGGGKASAYVFDLTDLAAFRKCVDQVARNAGTIDILVNNAGICPYSHFLEEDWDLWKQVLAVDLEAVYQGCKLVSPYMVEQRRGWIVNIASVQAFATDGRLGAYVAAKGAVTSFTKSLAVDLAPYGVLVNAIAPGCIHTPLSIVDGQDETETELFKEWYVSRRKIPLARAGRAEEVARAAVFLASGDCSYITGQVLVVDGGLMATF